LKSIEIRNRQGDIEMTITVDPETLAITVDDDTVRQLTQGTDFQRGINGLAMLDEIMAETDLDMLAALNIPKKQHQRMLKEMAKKRREILKKAAPPGIDPDALKVFCDES
jgi:hypothetical protein